jgi:hypothetical protein
MNRVLLVAWVAALVAAAPVSAGATAGKPPPPTPAPVVTAAANPDVAPGYFLVQGSRIVSKPFSNERACQKALKGIKHDMQPGSDTLVCAHRRP